MPTSPGSPSPSYPRTYLEGVRILKGFERTLRHLVRVRAELESEIGSVPEKFTQDLAPMAKFLAERHEEVRRLLRDWN